MRSAHTTILPNAIAKIDNRIARSYSPAAKLIIEPAVGYGHSSSLCSRGSKSDWAVSRSVRKFGQVFFA